MKFISGMKYLKPASENQLPISLFKIHKGTAIIVITQTGIKSKLRLETFGPS